MHLTRASGNRYGTDGMKDVIGTDAGETSTGSNRLSKKTGATDNEAPASYNETNAFGDASSSSTHALPATNEDQANQKTNASQDMMHAATQANGADNDANNLSRHAPIIIFVPARLRRVGKGKQLVIDTANRVDVDPSLVALIREAVATRDALLSGDYDSIEDMSRRTGIIKARLVSLVRLSWLAPDILRLVFDGRQPIKWTATKLLTTSKDLPPDWGDQRRFLGLVD
jgi:hypothetical protein